MGGFATGKNSKAISDRSGMEFPYDEMVKEWNGSLVHISEFEPKHPQIRRKKVTADRIALQNPRAQDFQQPADISSINPFAVPTDDTLVSSGGQGMMTADLTLPGQFAFSSNGMIPEDGSLQNRRRELLSFVGSVTIVIT
jgi:hypothetical protein